MSTAQTFRKKPVEIDAMQWDGTAAGATPIIDWVLANDGTATYECADAARCAEHDGDCPHWIAIHTLEGTMRASLHDWVIRGVQGEFYPCKPGIFDETYTNANSAQASQLGSAVDSEMSVEAPGAVVTEWVLVAAAQSFDEDGTTNYATSILHSDGAPTHRILGLLDHGHTRYQAHTAALEWESHEDGDTEL